MTFWLAALSAGLAIVVPSDLGPLLTGVACAAALAAWGLWRFGLSVARHQPDAVAPPVAALDQPALLEMALCATRAAKAAPAFDDALLQVSRVFKSELGLHDVRVQRVVSVSAAAAELAELIAGPPAFCAAPRRLRLDPGSALGRALLQGETVVGAAGGAVLPILADTQVVAVFELGPPTLQVAPHALQAALALVQFQLQLAGPALARRPHASEIGSLREPPGLDDNAVLSATPFAPAMATPSVPVPPPSIPPSAGLSVAQPSPVAADTQPLDSASRLDADALKKLAELDPDGSSRLVLRVLKTFASAAARLMVQLDAAAREDKLADVRYVVHTLKSSSASIGALPLSAICADIETMIRSDHTDGLPARLDALRTQMRSVLAEIDRLLGAGPT